MLTIVVASVAVPIVAMVLVASISGSVIESASVGGIVNVVGSVRDCLFVLVVIIVVRMVLVNGTVVVVVVVAEVVVVLKVFLA